MSGNDEDNRINQDNDRSNRKLNEESSQNKSNECLTQADQQSVRKTLSCRQVYKQCDKCTKFHKDYNAMNWRCSICNHLSKSHICKNKVYSIENQAGKKSQEEDNDLELRFIDINKIDTLEEAWKKAGPNYTSYDKIRGHGKRIIHKKRFDDIYDTCDDVNDNCDLICISLQSCKIPHKKLKINENWELSGKKSLPDKQFLHKKQFSCDKISQFVAEINVSTPKNSLYGKLQIVDSLQMDERNEFNESLAPEKINVQNLEFISTTSSSAMVGDIEKLIPICEETLKYKKHQQKVESFRRRHY